MAKNGIYTGIDIGTDTVKVLVTEYVSGEMNIVGVGNAKAEGLKNGIIVDIEKAAESIRRAVNAAEERAGITISSVSVGLPANQLGVEPCQGMVNFPGGSKEITDNDVVEVVSTTMMRSLVPEREIVSLEPKEFSVDGFTEISDPRGMYGVRLEMKGTLYTGPKTLVHNIIRTVERAGLSVDNIVIAPRALSKYVLTEGERKFGTIMIDMGAGQTTVAGVKDYDLQFAVSRPEGGDYITNDISKVLKTSVSNAEDIKLNYGVASTENTKEDENFFIDEVGQSEPVAVSEYYLSQIVEARVSQIFEKIRQDLEQNRALDYPGGVVLFGGAAAMPGIIEVAADILGLNTRLYVPSEMGLRNPTFAEVISIVNYVSRRSDIDVLVTQATLGTAPVAEPYIQPQAQFVAPVIQQPVVTEQPVQTQAPIAQVTPKPQPEEKKPGVFDRVRGAFGNMFE